MLPINSNYQVIDCGSYSFSEIRNQAREVFCQSLIPAAKGYSFDDYEHDLFIETINNIEDRYPSVDINDIPHNEYDALFMLSFVMDNGLRSIKNGIKRDPLSTDNNQALCEFMTGIAKKGAH